MRQSFCIVKGIYKKNRASDQKPGLKMEIIIISSY
jgi:hypothetical protein